MGTGVHVPAALVTLHASQVPSHAVSQHTPSTQWSEAHSALPPQLSPFALLLRHSD